MVEYRNSCNNIKYVKQYLQDQFIKFDYKMHTNKPPNEQIIDDAWMDNMTCSDTNNPECFILLSLIAEAQPKAHE